MDAFFIYGAVLVIMFGSWVARPLTTLFILIETPGVFVAYNFFTAIPLWLTTMPALIYNLITGKTFWKQEYLYLYATGTASYFIKLSLGESYGWLISLTTFFMAPIMWLFSILTSLLFVLPGILFIFIELIVGYFLYNGLLQIPLLSTPMLLATLRYR